MKMTSHRTKNCLNFQPGEIVEVLSESEIMATLDKNGTFEGLLFSPEMRRYCGKKLWVFKRVYKLIIEGIGMRRMKHTFILVGATCNGLAHGGCKKTCLFLWKDVWLKKASQSSQFYSEDTNEKIQKTDNDGHGREPFECQISGLRKATSPLPIWDARQYMWDIKSGTFSLSERIRILLTSFSTYLRKLLGLKVTLREHGILRRTPTLILNLKPGELVQVRSKKEIMKTLDTRNRNRGLEFTREMLKYCGKQYRVLKQIDIIIDEKTSELRKIANTVLLEGVTCDGKAHGGCPRNCFCLWREIWLSRVGSNQHYPKSSKSVEQNLN